MLQSTVGMLYSLQYYLNKVTNMKKCPVCSESYVHKDKCTNQQMKLERFIEHA